MSVLKKSVNWRFTYGAQAAFLITWASSAAHWELTVALSDGCCLRAAIFAFTVAWGAFLYPLAYLYTSNQMVLTVGIISDLIRGDVFQWGKIMAACLLASLPPIIIFFLTQRTFVQGVTLTGIKG